MRTFLLGLMVALMPVQALAVDSTRRFAVVVGSNDGGLERPLLRYANHDAKAFADVMETMGGVDRADTVRLADPTAIEVRQAIASLAVRVKLARDRGQRTEVLVYYSGHSDGEGILPEGERYPYADLRADLEIMQADV